MVKKKIKPIVITTKKFRQCVWDYYTANRRSFVWRDNIVPYRVVVSELMLQQTQTFRVAEKFDYFIQLFPSFEVLAQAPLALVIGAWKGLGYNRRARYAQQIAQHVVEKYAGQLPDDPLVLELLPGIGKATARSIVVFAYNKPEVFIETNIRAVFIHHFFNHEHVVNDRDIMPLIAKTLDKKNPREWYYALMDYGVMLKKQFKNPARRSAHHVVQSRFEGSNRQLRGKLLDLLLKYSQLSCADVYGLLTDWRPDQIDRALKQLVDENLIKHSADFYSM